MSSVSKIKQFSDLMRKAREEDKLRTEKENWILHSLKAIQQFTQSSKRYLDEISSLIWFCDRMIICFGLEECIQLALRSWSQCTHHSKDTFNLKNSARIQQHLGNSSANFSSTFSNPLRKPTNSSLRLRFSSSPPMYLLHQR